MITIQEISTEKADAFWKEHMKYLVEDEIISEEEDIEYFSVVEYRTVLIDHMERETDKHHMVYFVRDDKRIGAAQYNTYQSEDGALYYELNSEKEDSIRFWKSLGFVENGVDEWDMKVFVRN